MKWLEVIKLRSVQKDSALLDELLMPKNQPEQSGLVSMKTYRHAALDSDLSLHLCWDSEPMQQNGSPLGLGLAQSLKEFGLVDHSIWVEEQK
jgi:hypothetical protein